MTGTRETTRGARRGYALITSLMTVVVLLILGSAMLGLASTSRRLAQRRALAAQALNLAMGAADEAVLTLKEVASYTGYTQRSLGGGTTSVSVSTPAFDANARQILATGTITESGMTVSKQVNVTVALEVVPLVFKKAVAANSDWGITGNATITSSPLPDQGDIHSNGILRIGGGVTIRGRATATGPIVNVNGNPTISGGRQAGAPAVSFPLVSQAFKDQATYNGSTTGSLTVSDGRLLQGRITGSLTVNNPSGARVDGIVYVTGNVQINGPITGTGTVVTDGTISVNFSGTYPTGSVSTVAYISTAVGTAVSLGGSRQFRGLVYAPNGNVAISGSSGFTVLGSLLARSLSFNGNTTITRDTNFTIVPPPLPQDYVVRAWEEL